MEDTHFTAQDRHTLTELTKIAAVLESKLDRAISDISSMTNNFATKAENADHEQRIRVLEKATEDMPIIRKLLYGGVGFTLLTVLGAIIYLVVKH